MAWVASAPKSSTRSHGMCSDTRGASPVSAFTWAASAIFSNGLRGAPGVVNTLNRVPELPYAQLGTSIVNSSRPDRASIATVIASSSGSVGGGYCDPP